MIPLTRFRQSLAVWLTVLPMRGPRRAREQFEPETKSDNTLQALFMLLLCPTCSFNCTQPIGNIPPV